MMNCPIPPCQKIADFDGDGKTDFAVYHDGLWAVIESSNNQPRCVNWGLSGDLPVAGDYGGGGKTDIAVYRNGIWYLLRNYVTSIILALNNKFRIKTG